MLDLDYLQLVFTNGCGAPLLEDLGLHLQQQQQRAAPPSSPPQQQEADDPAPSPASQVVSEVHRWLLLDGPVFHATPAALLQLAFDNPKQSAVHVAALASYRSPSAMCLQVTRGEGPRAMCLQVTRGKQWPAGNPCDQQ